MCDGYSFNKNNEVSVNLASIKASYTASRFRANLALAEGTYMKANYADEPGILGNLYEGNVGINYLEKRIYGWMSASSLHILALKVL